MRTSIAAVYGGVRLRSRPSTAIARGASVVEMRLAADRKCRAPMGLTSGGSRRQLQVFWRREELETAAAPANVGPGVRIEADHGESGGGELLSQPPQIVEPP